MLGSDSFQTIKENLTYKQGSLYQREERLSSYYVSALCMD